ncbi:hypothetical protein Q3G72_029380 [Acer saccharum]|nr:hypothetical protein Q3G72_029380 [Acer saccharum]
MESKIKRSARGTKGSVRGSMCWCRPVHDQLRCTWTQPRASMHRAPPPLSNTNFTLFPLFPFKPKAFCVPHVFNFQAKKKARTKNMVKKISKERSKTQKKSSNASTRKASPPLPKCTLNKEFKNRLGSFRGRPMIIERGISTKDLKDTSIPSMVDRLGEVVEEFYARKNLDEFLKGGPVMVRGKEVQLEVVHINSYFDTKLPDDPELLAEMHDGVLWDNLYARQRVDFANDLVIVP